MLEYLREAEAIAERLNDDRRRGRVYALITNVRSMLDKLDEARESGTRALAIARALGDRPLGILTASFLGQMHYFGGEYEKAVDVATANLAALPADSVYTDFGTGMPTSIYDRFVLVLSLAQLGRFAEAVEHEAEVLRLAETTRLAYAISSAHWAASTRLLVTGDWPKARLVIENWIAGVRMGKVANHLTFAVASSAWALAELGEASEALNRLQEAMHLVERHMARGVVGNAGWAYYSLGRAYLLLGQLDEARGLGAQLVELIPGQFGFVANALHLLGEVAAHPDAFNPESGEAYYRQALALAEPRGMRPLVAHCHLGLGKLSRHIGNRQEAEEHLATAITMYREMGIGFWLQQAEMAMAGLA